MLYNQFDRRIKGANFMTIQWKHLSEALPRRKKIGKITIYNKIILLCYISLYVFKNMYTMYLIFWECNYNNLNTWKSKIKFIKIIFSSYDKTNTKIWFLKFQYRCWLWEVVNFYNCSSNRTSFKGVCLFFCLSLFSPMKPVVYWWMWEMIKKWRMLLKKYIFRRQNYYICNII